MNLYLLEQSVNNGYDTYDSVVVAAETEEEAKFIHPSEYEKNWDGKDCRFSDWCDVKDISVTLIGTATTDTKKGVVLASFNAG
jgi:hypothetical protein